MLTQIQIHTNPSASQKEKGDFFENLLRLVMETQRYKVTKNINFTGTEIDLLCEHMDRPNETALVECKARTSIVADDIKSFTYDLLVEKRADYGFFVHTSELQQQAAGMRKNLLTEYPKQIFFFGPSKVIELLEYTNIISAYKTPALPNALLATKKILLYTFFGKYWVTIISDGTVPTSYNVVGASQQSEHMKETHLDWISNLDDLNGLAKFEGVGSPAVFPPSKTLDAVAEIQEAQQWDDYLPVGSNFFVGRSEIRQRLYQFVQSPVTKTSERRIFFVEGKSGWGKSSLLAELRARSQNKTNKRKFFVLAIDSRSASTSEFVGLSVAKLITKAAAQSFIPPIYSKINIISSFDTLASDKMNEVLSWLEGKKRTLIIIFDQFEDIFRKEDIFRAFHKLMIDIHEYKGALIVGFSWKSEINIPIDNPAYGLWQQARGFSETFQLDEFTGSEIDHVLRELESYSGHQLPADLKRRLKENSQGFPWLTKKLSIHCYRQMMKGVTPEELVDQNLNVDELFKEDMEGLTSDQARALNHIAQRGYDGAPFDVAEVDEKIPELVINSLLGERLIVKSGGKYNVYWDIFRDFLVEGKPPTIGESFLLRQYPQPCIRTLELLFKNAPCTIEEYMASSEDEHISEGTALNRLRELRHIGAVIKVDEHYQLRQSIQSLSSFRDYIRRRLDEHIVVRSLRNLSSDRDLITHEDVVSALKENFKGYSFAEKTWATYAGYMIGWLRDLGIDFGRRLPTATTRTGAVKLFIPQWRPEKDIDLFLSLRGKEDPIVRPEKSDKGLYDLKFLGLLSYEGKHLTLTKRGVDLLKQDDATLRRGVAEIAIGITKILQAYASLRISEESDESTFKDMLAPAIESIPSESYRNVATSVLKSWAKFVADELGRQIY